MAKRKKDREGRADKSSSETVDDGSQLMTVRLTDDERNGRRLELVDWLVKKEQLESKKSAQVKKINNDLKLATQEIARLTREADTGEAFIDRQTDLDFAGTGKRPGAAAARAAELANDSEGAVA